jgi:hypothetical protein
MANATTIAFIVALLPGGAVDEVQADERASVVAFQDETMEDDERATTDTQHQKADSDPETVPQRAQGDVDSRYRYHNGRWWYLDRRGQWHWHDGRRWVLQQSRGPSGGEVVGQAQTASAAEADEAQAARGRSEMPFASPQFNTWFNAYRGFPTGRARLQTAEAGQVEMATSQIAEGEAPEVFEVGGIPSRQTRGPRAGVGRSLSGGGAWFNAGSPFGIRYGYGSGFGYGGYGFDNPYGYGSRSGSGGAYGYGFGEYGSVGGQTGERLSSLISGPVEEGGRLVGPEPPGIGAPARLETAVGGTYGKAGAGVRKLGESARQGGD